MGYTVTEGTGSTFAADVIAAAAAPVATQKVPYVKLDLGVAGSSVPLVNGQNTMANSLPIVQPSDFPIANYVGITVTQATSAQAYVANQCVGGIVTLANAQRVTGKASVLTSISVLDKDNQKAALTILFFKVNPAAATIADHTAFVWSTDNVNCIGQVLIPAANYTSSGSPAQAVATVNNLWQVLPATATSLFAAVITTGTPTYASTSSIQITYGLETA